MRTVLIALCLLSAPWAVAEELSNVVDRPLT